MTTPTVHRITLFCPPATAALRAGRFPDDDALDDDAVAGITAWKVGHAVCSPARGAQETAAALGFTPFIATDLRELDYGRWTGQSLKTISEEEPEALAAWLSDADAKPHGGESIAEALQRVAAWFGTYPWQPGHTLVIAPPAILRAIVLCALDAPARGYWHLDIAPMSISTLSGHPGHWRLSSLSVPVATTAAPSAA